MGDGCQVLEEKLDCACSEMLAQASGTLISREEEDIAVSLPSLCGGACSERGQRKRR